MTLADTIASWMKLGYDMRAEEEQWEMRAKTAESEVMRRPTVTELKDAVAAERERCERVIGNLMYESYDITPIECLSRALAAIRKGG